MADRSGVSGRRRRAYQSSGPPRGRELDGSAPHGSPARASDLRAQAPRVPEGRAPEGRAQAPRVAKGRVPEGPVPEGRAPGRGDTGSAVVEFTLVSVMLMLIVLGVLQLALVLHVRNTLVACAAEGARLAANADLGPPDGAERTRALAAEALAAPYAAHVEARMIPGLGGTQLVEVTLTAPLPLVGMLGPARMLRVTAHAVEEEAA